MPASKSRAAMKGFKCMKAVKVEAAEGPTEPPQRDRWGVSAAEGPMGPPHRGPWTHGPIGPTGPYGPMDPWAHRPYSWGFVYYLYSI